MNSKIHREPKNHRESRNPSWVPWTAFSTNTLSSKRLDAKRHYVIWAKALDGIWPVGHACAVLCWGTAAAVPDYSTAQAWAAWSTGQIPSSASAQMTWRVLASSLLLLMTLVLKTNAGIWSQFSDMSWTGRYVLKKRFQEFGTIVFDISSTNNIV